MDSTFERNRYYEITNFIVTRQLPEFVSSLDKFDPTFSTIRFHSSIGVTASVQMIAKRTTHHKHADTHKDHHRYQT